LFDRHPNLRLIISQNGHSIPALLPRIEALITSIPSSHRPKRRFIEVWQQNIYVSTADVLDVASMRALLEQIPVDRVLFAGNYPWEEKGKSLMGELKESRVLEEQDWERVACKNAETLFGLRGGGDKGKRVTGPKRSASFG
jgi:predicted TIM-barrel fold metal-dependent hydrolase